MNFLGWLVLYHVATQENSAWRVVKAVMVVICIFIVLAMLS